MAEEQEINWSRTSITLKVLGVEIWVLIPLIVSFTIWTKETFIFGISGVIFFSVLNFLGIRFVDFIRLLRRSFSNKIKRHPLQYLSRFRILNKEN